MMREVGKCLRAAASCSLASMSLQPGLAQDDIMVLDDMTQYYEPVEFDHAMHVDLLGDDSCADLPSSYGRYPAGG